MKFLRKIKTIKVKQTFVIADHIAHMHKGKKIGNNRKFLKNFSEKDFNKKLIMEKKRVLKFSEDKLNKIIFTDYEKRLSAIDRSEWFIADVHPYEVGVWKRAGNLPLRWTNKSLAETAMHVTRAFKKNSKLLKRRPKHAIPNILKIKSHIQQDEPYLYPIVFKGDTGTPSRKRLRTKMKGDIDDGCMRSIALAMSGKDPIRVYFGIPKENK